MASALQLMWQLISRARLVTVHVQIGVPVLPPAGSSFDAAALHAAVLAEMKRLIESPPAGPGESAL
jgi:hypothetical protein